MMEETREARLKRLGLTHILPLPPLIPVPPGSAPAVQQVCEDSQIASIIALTNMEILHSFELSVKYAFHRALDGRHGNEIRVVIPCPYPILRSQIQPHLNTHQPCRHTTRKRQRGRGVMFAEVDHHLKWVVTDILVLNTIFFDQFLPRPYCADDGSYQYSSETQKGGQQVPIVNETTPAEVSFNVLEQTCTIDFYVQYYAYLQPQADGEHVWYYTT